MDETTTSSEPRESRWLELGLLAGILGVQIAHSFFVAHTHGNLMHLPHLAHSSTMMREGMFFMDGPNLAGSNIPLGGPVYYWLSFPISWFRNPLRGAITWYSALEVLSLCVWIAVGRRRDLRPAVLWTSALLLALYPENKALYAENFTLAGILVVPAFMGVLAAIRTERLSGVVISGAAMALVVSVHQSCITLIPVALLSILVMGDRRLLRGFLWLVGLLGLLAALAGAVMVLGEKEASLVTEPVTTMVARKMWLSDLAAYAARSFRFPLVVAAVVLAIATLRRSEEARHPIVLAIVWFVYGYLVQIALLFTMERQGSLERLAWVNPARALLVGFLLAWVLGKVERLPLGPLRRAFDWRVVVAVGCIAATLVFTVMAVRNGRTRNQKNLEALITGCNCGFERFLGPNGYHLLFPTLAEVRMEKRTDLAQDLGISQRTPLGIGVDWYLSYSRGFTDPEGDRVEGGRAVAAPAFENTDLTTLPRAADCGFFVVVPVAEHFSAHDEADLDGSFLARRREGGKALLRIERHGVDELGIDTKEHRAPDETDEGCRQVTQGGAGADGSLTPLLTVGDETVHPSEGCAYCFDDPMGPGEVCVYSWFVFDLPPNDGSPAFLGVQLPPGLQPLRQLDLYVLGEAPGR